MHQSISPVTCICAFLGTFCLLFLRGWKSDFFTDLFEMVSEGQGGVRRHSQVCQIISREGDDLTVYHGVMLPKLPVFWGVPISHLLLTHRLLLYAF